MSRKAIRARAAAGSERRPLGGGTVGADSVAMPLSPTSVQGNDAQAGVAADHGPAALDTAVQTLRGLALVPKTQRDDVWRLRAIRGRAFAGGGVTIE